MTLGTEEMVKKVCGHELDMRANNRLKLTARGRPSADARQYRQPEPPLARGESAAARA